MSSGDMLEAYLFYIRHERGLAFNTIRACLSVQRAWESWLRIHACGRDWLQATAVDLNGFLRDRAHLADQTIGVLRWHLKAIYGWLKREGHALANLALLLSAQTRSPKTSAPWFVPTNAQIDALFRLPDSATVDGIQDRVMLELLYATGVRSHELLSMQVHRVWVSDRRAAVWGKGRKERMVVMSESAAKWVGYYLKIVHPRLLRRRRWSAISTKGDGFLFPSCHTQGHLSYSSLQQRIKGYALQAGMPLLTAHALRRAFATHLYQGGADLRTIQMLLGHAHLTTTTIYTQVVTNHLREVVECHHPRGVHYQSTVSSGALRGSAVHPSLQ